MQEEKSKMSKIDLSKYGITGTTEVVYNPSYEVLFEEETKPELEGFEKGQESELGAVNVMTGVYTGRSPKDKFIVMDENSKDTCHNVNCTKFADLTFFKAFQFRFGFFFKQHLIRRVVNNLRCSCDSVLA